MHKLLLSPAPKDTMFNIHSSVQAILSAEKVTAIKSLTHDERIVILTDLRDTMTIMEGLPAHILLARKVIERILESERHNAAPGQEQGRTAQGVEEPATLDARRTEEGTEAAKGTTQGVEEPSQDAGRTSGTKSRKGKSAPTPAPATSQET